MSISLINITTQGNPRGHNVLAQDGGGQTAMQNAIVAGVPQGDTLIIATELGGRAIDVVIAAAVAPVTDGTPKALFLVNFRGGSGTNGSTPQPLLVLAWPQVNGNVTTSAATLAAQAAAASASAVVSQVNQLAQVDMDATGSTPILSNDLTKFGFRCLFTFAELNGIDHPVNNANLTQAQQAGLATIRTNFMIADDILLSDPNTIAGVEYLVSCGLLTQTRASQILANQPYLTVTAPNITGVNGTAIAVNCVAAGGSGTGFSFTATGLPAGLAMSTTGRITGTVAAAVTAQYTVNVTDSAGDTATNGATITIT